MENEVTITERLLRQLTTPLKSRFVKWKRSPELGTDLYYAATVPITLGFARTDAVLDATAPTEVLPKLDALPTPHSGQSRWMEALKARKFQIGGGVLALLLVIFGLTRLFAPAASTPPAPTPPQQVWLELVQTDDWRHWRKQVHQILSVDKDKVTEDALADALSVKMPARPEHAAPAMRRDQAIADVLMAYKGETELLWKRFGIDENNFLGTGLSKPNTAKEYMSASVHEYLIPNLPDNDDDVWTWKLEHNDLRDMTIKELCESETKLLDPRNRPVQRISDRVNEKDMAKPAVIRFAILFDSNYKRTLGHPDRYRVFASNLAEVWNTSVKEASERSGHTYSNGKSLYVWVFVPKHPTQVVPATWGEVLHNLPTWLSEKNKN